MSISPGIVAMPLIDAPGFGAPSSLPASGVGGDGSALSQAEFSSMLNNGGAESHVQHGVADPHSPRQGTVSHEVRLGDQVLSGLEKLGRSVEAMNDLGPKSPASGAPPATAASQNAASQNGAPKQGAGNALDNLFEVGLQHQQQVYMKVFEFELVEESAQSMMKSLKSLLTQGGG